MNLDYYTLKTVEICEKTWPAQAYSWFNSIKRSYKKKSFLECELTGQNGSHATARPATPKLCSRHSAGLVGLFVCTIILQIPFVCVTGAALENPVRPS